jgi:hypothetical protein
MIATDITGQSNSGATQLFDFLNVVSNPTLYQEKIKALQEAIEQNRKYVEAVAPVSEILAARELANNARQAAEAELISAKEEAERVRAQAKKNATETVKNAKELAEKRIQEVLLVEAKLTSRETAVQEREQSVVAREIDLDSRLVQYQHSVIAVEKLREETAESLASLDAMKQELRNKLALFSKFAE